MNTEHPTTPAEHPASSRPLGFWLRATDRAIFEEFARVLGAEDLDRRDWMILSAIAGTVEHPGLATRLRRGGKRVRALADRGWITSTADGWQLTDTGRAAHERVEGLVTGIRSRVTAAVGDADYATTVRSLEAITRALGGDADGSAPGWGRGRGRGPRRGFGGRGSGPHGFGPHGFGPRRFGPHGFDERGFAPHGFGDRGFGPHDGAGHPHHRGHGCGPQGHHGFGDARPAGEQAYERGFTAGLAAGRAAANAPAGTQAGPTSGAA